MYLDGKENTKVSGTWPASADEARELVSWQGAFFARANGMVLLTEADANPSQVFNLHT